MSEPYYSDEHVTLYHADCRDVLPSMGGVDAVITDPPYSEHVHGVARRSNIEHRDRGAKYGADTRRVVDFGFTHLTPDLRGFVAEQFARIARRWVLVFSDTESAHLWRDDLTEHGLDYVRTGAWVKIGSTPQFSGDRPATGHESVTIAHATGRKRWNGGGQHAVWTHPIVLDRGGKTPRLHTTQKPLGLMAQLVGLFTDPGETVLDPFAGSGTTLVAARQAGRKSIGVEQDERYCETIARRLDQGVLDFEGAS